MKCFICQQSDTREPLFSFKSKHLINADYHKSCLSIYHDEAIKLSASFLVNTPLNVGKSYSTEMMEEFIKKIKTQNYDENSIIKIDSLTQITTDLTKITTCSRYNNPFEFENLKRPTSSVLSSKHMKEPVKQQEETEEDQPKAAQFKRNKFDQLKQRNAKLASVSKFFRNY